MTGRRKAALPTERISPGLDEGHNRDTGHRILITTWDGSGNAIPACHLALRLLRRRSDVLLMVTVPRLRYQLTCTPVSGPHQ